MDFLSTAIFGPDRVTYWERCLDAAGAPEPSAPLADRLNELEEEIADLERRLSRQVANLEGDDVTPALRRRIADRVAELEAEIEGRRGRVRALRDHMLEVPPAPTEVALLLDRLPLLADRLAGLPQRELRALFDALQLKLVYQPADHAIDVDLTLAAVDGAATATELRRAGRCTRLYTIRTQTRW